jgi:hypothetical protein
MCSKRARRLWARTSSSRLSTPYGWSRNGVIVEIHVNIHDVAGFCPIDETGDRDQGSWRSASAPGDGYLCTFDVKLGNSGGVGVVNCELLDAEEVVSVWECGWDCVCVCFCLVLRQRVVDMEV